MNASRALSVAALILLASACAVQPRQPVDTQAAADANADLGIDFMRKGHNEAAVERLQRALSYQPDHVRANWALAVVYMRLEEYDSADQHFQRAIATQPTPELLNSYGVFLCQRGRTEQALTFFDQAASDARYARAADALANAGLCLAQAGQNEQAEPYLRKALAANPRHPQALAQLARLRYEARDHLGARGLLQRRDAVAAMQGDLLLLAARNALALGDSVTARDYLGRYNEHHAAQKITMDQLADTQDDRTGG